jgi:hypothetical protein
MLSISRQHAMKVEQRIADTPAAGRLSSPADRWAFVA